jgi:hypothetical protein
MNTSRPISSNMTTGIISKNDYRFENISYNIQLQKMGVGVVPELIENIKLIIEEANEKLENDRSTSERKKEQLLAKRISETLGIIPESITGLLAEIETRTSNSNDLIKRASGFKDSMDFLLVSRHLEAIENKTEFMALVRDNFDVARLLINDPVAQKRYGDEVSMASARETIGRHVLGDSYEQYATDKVAAKILESYSQDISSVANKMRQRSGL